MINTIDRGILFMLLSALVSALNGALAKVLTDDLSAMELVFFRNVLGVFIILYTLKHTPPILSGGKLHLLFMRGFFGFSAMILFFYTIAHVHLTQLVHFTVSYAVSYFIFRYIFSFFAFRILNRL